MNFRAFFVCIAGMFQANHKFVLLFGSRPRKMTSYVRAKNTATVSQVALLLKANVTAEKLADWLKTKSNDPSDVVLAFQPFIIDLLKATARPTKKLLESACMQVFIFVSGPEAASFGVAIEQTVSTARQKKKSMTTGAKLGEGLKVVISCLYDNELSDKTIAVVRSGAKKWSPKKAPPVQVEKANPGAFDWAAELRNLKSQSFGSLPVRDSFGEDEVVDLLSSQEEHASASAPCAPASTAEGFAEWLDFGGSSSAADVAVKRKVGASVISSTSLKPGPDGFAVATWPDGSTSVTELANLLLETSCKPKAKAKGKAKAKPKAKCKAKAKPKAAASSSHVDRKGKSSGKGKAKGKRPCAEPLPDTYDSNGRSIPGSARDALFPDGCSKCRWRRGCTPSCWTGRCLEDS